MKFIFNKNKKKIITFLIFSLAIVFFVYFLASPLFFYWTQIRTSLFSIQHNKEIQKNIDNQEIVRENLNEIKKVCIENYCYEVEIADTVKERQKGLMFRENLDKDKGMLFVFSSSDKHSFWMKNTLIPLDIIWINNEATIVDIRSNFQPCKKLSCPNVFPQEKAKYALEVNGGQAKAKGFKTGMKVQFQK